MRKKLVIGLIVMVAGMILQELSYIADIWILRVLGGIVWPVGMWISINALISLEQKKKSNDSSNKSTEIEHD